MKSLLVAILLFLSATNVYSIEVHKNDTVRLTGNNWCPQHCQYNSKDPGYIIEIVTTAFNSQGVKVVIEYQPWLRAIMSVNSGYQDGLLTPAESEESHLLKHQIKLANQRFCFYKLKKENFRLEHPTDFHTKKIAFVKGNKFGGDFTSYIYNKNNKVSITEIVPGSERFARRAFLMLLNQRFDAIALTEDLGDFYLKNNKILNKISKGYCTKLEELNIGFSKVDLKRSKRLADILDKGILNIMSSGVYDEIMNKYNIQN